MAVECKNCPKCHKTGLPIIPAIYSIGLKYNPELLKEKAKDYERDKDNPDFQIRHGKGVPALSGTFRATDKEGGSEIPLDDATQYTLRRPRAGCFYVYNEKDPISTWRCYEVSKNSLITEITPAPEPLTGEEEEQDDIACFPEKCLATAEIITIPYASCAKEVWICFSDTRWTAGVLKKHESADYRARHMRRIDVAAWMCSQNPTLPHAVNIHTLDPKAPPIAEYVDAGPHFKEAFSFSEAQFNQKGPGIDLEKAKEILRKVRDTPGMEKLDDKTRDEEVQSIHSKVIAKGFVIVSSKGFSGIKALLIHIRNLSAIGKLDSDAEIPGLADLMSNFVVAGGAAPAVGKLTPFEHLLHELKRFYARAHDGMRKNTLYTDKAMLLALDDPAGMAQDLNGLMNDRLHAFGQNPDDRRRLHVNGCIEKVCGSVLRDVAMKTAREYERKVTTGPDAPLQDRYTKGGVKKVRWRPMKPEEQEEFDAIRKGDSQAAQEEFEKVWAKEYAENLKAGDRQNFLDKFSDRFWQYRKSYVHPLGSAHAKWLESDRMVQYFTCNFDPDNPKEARAQSGSFPELFSRCVGTSAEQPACSELYVKWLTTAALDEKNLLWRALCCNSDFFSREIIAFGARIEAAQETLASACAQFASSPSANPRSSLDTLARNTSTWAKDWWAVISIGRKEIAKALIVNAAADTADALQQVDDAKAAFDQAVKHSEELTKGRETIIKRQAMKEQRYQNVVNEALTEIDQIYLLRQSPEYQNLQKSMAAAHKGLQAPAAPVLEQLTSQMQGPFVTASRKASLGKRAANLPLFKRVIAVYSATPEVPFTLQGSPRDVAVITASRYRGHYMKGWGSGKLGEMVNALPATPKNAITSRFNVRVDSGFLVEALNIATMPGYEIKAMTEFMGGKFIALAEHAHGALSDIWQMDALRLKYHATIQDFDKKLVQLDQESKALAKAEQGLVEDLKNQRRVLEERMTASNRATNELVARSAQESRMKRLIAGFERAYPAANLVAASLVYWSLWHQLDQFGASAGAGDKKYQDAVNQFRASIVFIIGAAAEAGHRYLLAAPVIRNLRWAISLKNSARAGKVVGVIGAVATAPLTIVQAMMDWEEAKTAWGNEKYFWAFSYGVSMAVGIGTTIFAIAFALGIVANPIALGFAIAYALISLAIFIFTPDPTKKWLKECVFGKDGNKQYDDEWKKGWSDDHQLELVDFKQLCLTQ